MEKKREMKECKRCGWQWFTSFAKVIVCPNPKCHSPYWDSEKKAKSEAGGNIIP